MNKDLFEQQIGETLRKAESTPPAGAWELIKSQIAVPYTPPFKFPMWTVVAVSAILLGGMALSDQYQNQIVITSVVANVDAEEGNAEISAAPITAQVEEAPTDEGSLEIQIVEEANELEASEEIGVAALAESVDVSTDHSNSELTISTEVSEQSEISDKSQLPLQIQAAQPLNALVEQTQVEAEKTEANIPTPETTVESKLAIEGAKTCYTPCELSLSAKGNAAEYSWDAASFGLIEGKNLKLTINEPQTLTVYALAKYDDGSDRSLPRTIEVKAGSELFVPNSFTPNGDGVNDSYLVIGSGIESFSLTIINSKGKVIFQTSNINEAWNFEGSSNELDNEFYTAIVRAVGIDGKVISASERLTINP
ncbi:MAG: gliding motility-associated-like protein [Cryomorphaceae bacterium]